VNFWPGALYQILICKNCSVISKLWSFSAAYEIFSSIEHLIAENKA